MQTILMIMGILVLGLMALIFLFVFLKMFAYMNDQYNVDDTSSDNPDENIDIDSFRMGFSQGAFLIQMGLYKLWKDSEESMIIGTFDNLRGEIDQNVTQFFQDKNEMKNWNDQFLKYVEAKKKEEPPK